MAYSTLINAQTVAANTSYTEVGSLALTSPVTGVSANVTVTASAALVGCVLLAAISLDGTTFDTPFKVAEVLPGESRYAYFDAKNAAKVQFTVHNRDTAVTQTVTVGAVQV